MKKRADGPRTVPTDVAAIAVGVTPATVRKWASRGKIKRYGRPGRAEYAIDELLQIAASRSGLGSHEEAPDGEEADTGE
jgi:hypothetical protein